MINKPLKFLYFISVENVQFVIGYLEIVFKKNFDIYG